MEFSLVFFSEYWYLVSWYLEGEKDTLNGVVFKML
jgi:hypothetical protein